MFKIFHRLKNVSLNNPVLFLWKGFQVACDHSYQRRAPLPAHFLLQKIPNGLTHYLVCSKEGNCWYFRIPIFWHGYTDFTTVVWCLIGEATNQSKLLQLMWWLGPRRLHHAIMSNCNLWPTGHRDTKPQGGDFNQGLNFYKIQTKTQLLRSYSALEIILEKVSSLPHVLT